MDVEKEQSIKNKLEAIKTEDETSEVRIRKLKSLINQMNLRLNNEPSEKQIILTLQILGYEAILYVLDNDCETNKDELQKSKEQIQNLITITQSETLS